MDIRRIVLYAALAFISYSLITAWQTDYPSVAPAAQTTSQLSNEGHLLPQLNTEESQALDSSTTPLQTSVNETSKSKSIQVTTDVLNITIDLKQGDIVGAKLLAYPLSVEEKNTPFTLLEDNPKSRYVANSSLVVASGNTLQSMEPGFTVEKDSYVLEKDEKNLTVTLNGVDNNGLQVTKKFVFTQGSYVIDIVYTIANQSSTTWKGYLNTQLLRSSPKEDTSSIFHVGSFTGASYSNPGVHNFKKITFSQMNKGNLEEKAKGGWTAMQQHYFLSAWIPDENSENTLYTRASNADYTIGLVSQPLLVSPEQQKHIHTRLYVGPEVADVLKTIAPHLDQTVDYGWLWFISSLLFSVMKMIYNLIGNWGWSIILVTVLIKLAFYRLSATSYRSMAGMRKLQPKLQALRERYGDDKAKMSQATMELYRQEKLNPLGGCLPIIIQIPVFIALYWVLLESVELRQAPFLFWINDLAAADPYHILPLIMGATMLIQQRLNPAPPDPIQAKVMMLLPIVFTALFWSFPAGLVLYWVVNNTLSILQQWYITRKYDDEKTSSKKTALISK